MQKRLVVIILYLFILTGCKNNKEIACNFIQDNKSVDLQIKAINDEISSINIRTSFDIPNSVMFDENKYDFLVSQLDESYHFEDNKLIREYSVDLDKIYSLSKTLDNLRKQRFYCE